MDLNTLVQPVVTLARQAGARIMEIYASDFAVSHKQDASPLTEADLASHQTLLAGLQQLTPDIPVLSEESAQLPFSQRSQWSRYWLIDPLDGTKEFIKRNGEFTVNVALIEQHQPVLGVVYVPATGVSYFAARGYGAFRQPQQDEPEAIRVRRLDEQNITVVGSRSHAGSSLDVLLKRLGKHELIAVGSSLKFCLVAEGLADFYPRLGPTSEWDTAAAHCVVEQAGGTIVTSANQALLYNSKDSLLNPYFLVFADAEYDWLACLDS